MQALRLYQKIIRLLAGGCLLVGFVGCSSFPQQDPLARLFSEDAPIIVGASTLEAYRVTLEELPLTKDLLSQGPKTAQAAHVRLGSPNVELTDFEVAVLAYLIEKKEWTPALSTLEDYLLRNAENPRLFWSPYFLVRTLLLLKGIPDTGYGYQEYSSHMIIKALKP